MRQKNKKFRKANKQELLKGETDNNKEGALLAAVECKTKQIFGQQKWLYAGVGVTGSKPPYIVYTHTSVALWLFGSVVLFLYLYL